MNHQIKIEDRIQALNPLGAGLIAAATVFTAAMLSGATLYLQARQESRAAIQSALIRTASMAAVSVNGDAHQRFTSRKQEKTAQYAAAVAPLKRILKANGDVRHVYTCILKSGRAYFVLDPTSSDQKTAQGTERKSHILQPCNSPTPAMLRAFRTGRPGCDDTPSRDAGGAFISGYAPIRDSKGHLAGIVSVDLSADRYLAYLAKTRQATQGGVVIALLVSGLVGLLFAIAHRMGAQSRAEKARSALYIATQKQALEMIASEASLSEVLDALCLKIEQLSDGMLCAVLLADPEGTTLRVAAAPHVPEGFRAGLDTVLIGPREGSSGAAAHSRKTVVVPSIANDPVWAKYADIALEHGIRAAWSAPLFSAEGDLLGAFSVYFDSRRSPRGDEMALVETGAHVAAIAVERKRAEERLRRSEENYRSVINNVKEVIFQTDRQGRFTFVNPAFYEISGFTPEQVIGQSYRQFLHPDDHHRHDEMFRPLILRKKAFYREEVRCLTARKDYRWIEAHARLLVAPDGRITGVTGTMTDVTERKQAVEALLDAHDMLETRVEERTAELAAANKSLQAEVSERSRAEEEIISLNGQLERRYERLAALRRIDVAISSSVDIRLTLGIVLDQVVSQLHVDAAEVLLCDPHTQTLEYAAGRGFGALSARRTGLQMGRGPAGLAVMRGQIFAVPDLAQAPPSFESAVRLQDDGFRAYYAVPLLAKGQIKGVLEVFNRTPLESHGEWMDFLETLAGQAAIAVDNASLFERLQRSNMELTMAYDATIEGWSRALDLRDKETDGHSQRVTEMTVQLARAMGMNDAELVQVRRGALLHDIGKMGIPDNILLKPGKLDDDEWVIMRKHPVYAYEMLSPIAFLLPALDIPYCHHEKWDGTGYPRGLKGEQIPLSARLFAAVDVWDALRSDRPYRKGWSLDRVIEHIASLSGTHFEPRVVDIFLRTLQEEGEPGHREELREAA